MSEAVRAASIPRRLGDAIEIDGGYQHKALTEGFVVQRFWHAEKTRMIRKFAHPAPGDRVLDIGCGSGVVSNALADMGASVIAVDGNQHAINYARRTFGREEVEFRLGQVEDIDVPLEWIDKSYCLEVVEHIYPDQVTNLLARVHALTKAGGTIAITTPNYDGVWPAIEWTLDSLKLVPHLDGDQHVTRFTSARLREMLAATGWSVEMMTTFSTVAPWVSIMGWKFAERVAQAEDALSLKWGSILFAVARKNVA